MIWVLLICVLARAASRFPSRIDIAPRANRSCVRCGPRSRSRASAPGVRPTEARGRRNEIARPTQRPRAHEAIEARSADDFPHNDSRAGRNEDRTSETDARADRAEAVDEADRAVSVLCGRLIDGKRWSRPLCPMRSGRCRQSDRDERGRKCARTGWRARTAPPTLPPVFATGTTALQQTFPLGVAIFYASSPVL